MTTYDIPPNAIVKCDLVLVTLSNRSTKPTIQPVKRSKACTKEVDGLKSKEWQKRNERASEMFVDLLRVARSLAVAAHDLYLIRLDRLTRVVHLERNVLNQESPDFVAKAIRIKMTLPTSALIQTLPLPQHLSIP
jgi:hypothetical protein